VFVSERLFTEIVGHRVLKLQCVLDQVVYPDLAYDSALKKTDVVCGAQIDVRPLVKSVACVLIRFL
jgi:hypothetical protein